MSNELLINFPDLQIKLGIKLIMIVAWWVCLVHVLFFLLSRTAQFGQHSKFHYIFDRYCKGIFDKYYYLLKFVPNFKHILLNLKLSASLQDNTNSFVMLFYRLFYSYQIFDASCDMDLTPPSKYQQLVLFCVSETASKEISSSRLKTDP